MLFMLLLASCAYRLGSPDRGLPGGYRQVYIPMFKNMSQEPGIEVAFTNALIQEFESAKIARVTDAAQAEVIVEATIEKAQTSPSGDFIDESLPTGVLTADSYAIAVEVGITLKRSSDRSVLWKSSFVGNKSFSASKVTVAGVNSVNPLYNLSAKRQNIDQLAATMMSEAHDRMTENF